MSATCPSLVLKGISGPPDHRLAIINNHTFGVGDEADSSPPRAGFISVALKSKTNSVVIESAGQRHELKYTSNP